MRHPRTNGVCELLNRTILEEFYEIAFRTKIYKTTEQLNDDFHVAVATRGKVLENIQLSKNRQKNRYNSYKKSSMNKALLRLA